MSFIKTLLGQTNIIETIKDTADEFIYSKEERAAHELELEKIGIEAEERLQNLEAEEYKNVLNTYLELEKLSTDNTKSAREREVAITTNINSGWFNRNIMPIIATFILLSTVTMYLLLIYKRQSIVALDMAVVGGIIDTFKTLSTLIVGYYFGSSLGSQTKDLLLKEHGKH
jgi:hypothetical protein